MSTDPADRRARNEFGYTAWGADWLRLAEPTTVTRPDPLLPRARSIARNIDADVVIEGRIARATIARGGAASVAHVEFEPMNRDTAGAVTEFADLRSLTDDAHARLVAAGRSPAPALANADCSCRARTVRCLHVLTLLYLLVRRVDDDPTLALTLQGYTEAAPTDRPPASVAAPRWIPLSAIDPARFYEPEQPAG